MTPKNLTNEELLQSYKNLDAKGFDLFYKRNHSLIFNFLLSKLGNQADAEEAFQETFLRIHKSIFSYDSMQNALAWVFTIARNAAIDLLRKRRNLNTVNAEIETIADLSNFESIIVARETLRAIMSSLTAEETNLLQRRFLNDESYEEIAAGFGIKTEGARQRVSRLLKKLTGNVVG